LHAPTTTANAPPARTTTPPWSASRDAASTSCTPCSATAPSTRHARRQPLDETIGTPPPPRSRHASATSGRRTSTTALRTHHTGRRRPVTRAPDADGSGQATRVPALRRDSVWGPPHVTSTTVVSKVAIFARHWMRSSSPGPRRPWPWPRGRPPRRRVGTTASSVNYRGVLVYRRIKQAGVTALVATGLVVAGVAAPASAASTGGAGGALTNRLDQSFTSAGLTSSYHIVAAGLDWSRPVGLLVYTDGSGGYGLDNPNSTYLLDADGDAGLVAVARKHNLLLLTPEAPAPGCDGTDNCWYDSRNAVGKARWSSDLISRVTSQYDIDLDRVVIGGYSSGAQWTTRFFLPAHGEAHSVDLAVAIAYGGAP